MRRWLTVVASLIAALGLTAPAVMAQPAPAAPPAPKVTINGLVDNVISWSRNMSLEDNNYDRTGDTEWYARTRVRPDITAEVGTTKFVLGLEIDATWGDTGTSPSKNHFGTTHSWDLNTDVNGVIEIKWAYTEFDTPWIPNSRIRLGAQPWAVTYKPGVHATGDFAGGHWTWAITPQFRLNVTYAQIEEEATGFRDGFTVGEDYAIILSPEIMPFKGLDIRPIFSFAKFEGNTSTAARQGRGGISATSWGRDPSQSSDPGETRFTIGLDSRLRIGAFSLDPTIFYQFGDRERFIPGVGQRDQDRSAWFLDLRGGFRAGPLLLEAAFIYTTGNDADEDITNGREDINFYEPISTDTNFYITWAEIFSLGIDYFYILHARASGLNPGVAIGYDKYGLMRIGARASYALTPTFTIRGAVHASWTAEDVDTTSTFAPASGLTPRRGRGDEDYLGTEIDLGLTWRFAPNVAFDLVGAYLFAGDALAYGRAGGGFAEIGTDAGGSPDPEDVKAVIMRVRYTW